MQPSFLFELLLDYRNSLLYGLAKKVIKKLQRVQNRCIYSCWLFCQNSVILQLFLRSSTGSRLIFGLNSKYLLLLTTQHGILGLQRKICSLYLHFNIRSYGRRAFSVAAPLSWNSLPQHIGMLYHWTFLKDS